MESNESTLSWYLTENEEMEPHVYSDARANVRRTARSNKKVVAGARFERIYQLKRTRAGMKAYVTKLRNELQSLMSDYENIDQVREKFEELNKL